MLDCVQFKLPLMVIENFQISQKRVTKIDNYLVNHSNLVKYSSAKTTPNLDQSLQVKVPQFMNQPNQNANIGREFVGFGQMLWYIGVSWCDYCFI